MEKRVIFDPITFIKHTIIHTSADKTTVTTGPASAGERTPDTGSDGLVFADNRPETHAQLQLKHSLAETEQLHQSKAYDQLIDTSPQIARATTLQRMADRFAASSSPFTETGHGKNGLPTQLKAGIEQLSGYAMDDVRVHYHSEKPAQLQAHAFAQGTDIHLASGQEHHLPHEAWHVVQQKQGRVQPTVQLKGEAMNDDSELEQEADQMGKKAEMLRLSETRTGANPTTPAPLRTNVPLQRKVIQRISTQIRLDEKNLTILQIVLRGRPPRIFGNSMGDHTTGFIVQTEGLNIALTGMNLRNAIIYVNNLRSHLIELPGFKFLGIDGNKASTKNGELFLHEYQRLTTCTTSALKEFDGNNYNQAIDQLQQAINAYLIARELIPFSTVNVRAKTSDGGKGHGESVPATILSTYERNPKCGFDNDQLRDAAMGLFDSRSSGMLAVEHDESTLQAMSGGISFGTTNTPAERAKLIWHQHLLSIMRLFPTVYKQIGKSLEEADPLKQLNRLQALNVLSMLKSLDTHLNAMQSTIQSLQYAGKILKGDDTLNQTTLKIIATLIRQQQRALDMLNEIYSQNERSGGIFDGSIREAEHKVGWIENAVKTVSYYDESLHKEAVNTMLSTKSDKDTLQFDKDKPSYPVMNVIRDTRTFQQGNPMNPLLPANQQRHERRKKLALSNKEIPEASKYDKPAKDPNITSSTLSQQMNPMSIQVTLDQKTGLIADMLSDGRPPSPFSGTMGAHTTSWVVHLDRARTQIRNQSVEQAVANIQKMVGSILRQGLDLEGESEKHVEKKVLGAYRSTYNKLLGYQNKNPKSVTISGLQEMIAEALTFYNMIPGVTRDATDTGGKAEGVYRRVMLNYEFYGQGTQKEVKEAIRKLYDGDKDHMYGYHKTIMKEAYPNAYRFAKTGEPTVKKQPLPQVNPETENDDDTGSYTLTNNETSELRLLAQNSNWLVSVNNCLINAVLSGAGLGRPTADQVIRIRTALGVPVGVMLAADQRTLDIILAELHLDHLGAVVLYEGSNYTDQTSDISDTPIYIYHDGINHFTSLYDQQERLKDKVKQEPEKIVIDEIIDEIIDKDSPMTDKTIKDKSSSSLPPPKKVKMDLPVPYNGHSQQQQNVSTSSLNSLQLPYPPVPQQNLSFGSNQPSVQNNQNNPFPVNNMQNNSGNSNDNEVLMPDVDHSSSNQQNISSFQPQLSLQNWLNQLELDSLRIQFQNEHSRLQSYQMNEQQRFYQYWLGFAPQQIWQDFTAKQQQQVQQLNQQQLLRLQQTLQKQQGH